MSLQEENIIIILKIENHFKMQLTLHKCSNTKTKIKTNARYLSNKQDSEYPTKNFEFKKYVGHLETKIKYT